MAERSAVEQPSIKGDDVVDVKRVEPLAPGVWGVVATPFDLDGEVDTGSLGRLVSFYESVGAVGLTVLGVFGEARALSAEERHLVLSTVAESSRLPIVAGMTSLETDEVLAEIDNAQSAVEERLVAAMIQVNSERPGDVVDHLQRINRATGVAVVLQDYPKSSGVSITTDDLIDVVEDCSFVCAIKAEAPPTSVAIARMTVALEGVSIFGGLGGQGLLDELAAGSAGAMTGFSYPEALVACVSAWLAGDELGARSALLPYLPLINFEQQPAIALGVRKELLRRRGLISTAIVRPPAARFPAELDVIAEWHLALVDSLGAAAGPIG